MIAHVAGVPVEELLLQALSSGAGAGLLLARLGCFPRAVHAQSQETGGRSGKVRPWAGREVDGTTRMS